MDAISSAASPAIPTPGPRPIALITGASRGLGRSMAEHLAARGVDLLVTYQHQAGAAADLVAAVAAQGGRAVALPLDVGESSGFPAFAQRVGAVLADTWQRERLDFLVHNAGIGLNAPVAETREDQFDRLMGIHLKGPFFLTQALLPRLADGGRIVFVSTGLTRFCQPGFGAYAAMKGGVEVLSRYLAKELGSRGIAVNTLAPGAIETDFGDGVVRDNPAVNAYLASQTALGRVGRPEDIGRALAALLLPENAWITGQRIEVSGGMFL